MGDLEGKKAVVTGGAQGIGNAIVMELASRGCDVVIGDINLPSAEKTAKKVASYGIQSLALRVDVTQKEDVEHLIKQTVQSFNRIDIFVNNAGITRDVLLMRMHEKDWDMVLNVNLKGAFFCTQKVIRSMMKQRSGKIINISSVVGIMGNPSQANYAASKAGLIGFTKSVAKEVASRNIQVNAVAPGYIETEMTAILSEEVKSSYLASIPAKRPGTAVDVAKVVGFLASPDSDYITGQVICVDGGLLMA